MTGNRNTSRVFETARQFKGRLVTAQWPYDERAPDGVVVTFSSSVDPGRHSQTVQVLTDIGDDSRIAWRAMPGLRDESFDVVALVSVYYVNTDPDEDLETIMLDRLEGLADVIQREFWDDQASVIAGRHRPLSIPEAVDDSAVGNVSLYMDSRTDGLFGQAVITYAPKFRI